MKKINHHKYLNKFNVLQKDMLPLMLFFNDEINEEDLKDFIKNEMFMNYIIFSFPCKNDVECDFGFLGNYCQK